MTANLLPLVEALAGVEVLLVGDLMLDRYVWGDVSRISPEAPVQVLRVEREEVRLGGAGSVIANLSALGARVHALGVLGTDRPGDRSAALLAELPGVDASGILRDPAVPTTEKTRVIARAQHLLRIDRDSVELPADVQARLEAAARERLASAQVVLLSDYGKGAFAGELAQRLAAAARARGVPVLVDPHPSTPFARFRGATGMTPNRKETAGAVEILPRDPESILAAARALVERFELDWAAVTLDRDGVYLLRSGEAEGRRFPAKERDVFDVAGAGDMVLSVLGLALGAGAPLEDALQLANVAAGWEVEQLGVVPITPAALTAELRGVAPPQLKRKIVDFEAAAARLELERRKANTIVFTNGCFDLLHAGHVHFLQGCRSKGDFLVVGLNTDESVRSLGKGENRPVLPLEERAAVLAGLEAVDLVVPFAESTPLALIDRLRPDVLCKGEDYRGKVVVGRELVEGYGGRVELVELLPGLSTTNIISRINAAR